MAEPQRTAGIVLAGGRSTRMGSPKATLEWHGSTLVRRAAGIVGRVVDGPVVVVRAAGQRLPALPPQAEVVADARDERGPLEGIAAGLRQIGERAAVVFVTGVDAPLLHPALVACMLRSLGPADDAAVPHFEGFDQPLAAAYRREALARALRGLLASDERSMRALVARLHVRALDEAALLADQRVAELDPDLHSLRNVNTAGEYETARALPAPVVAVRPRPGAAPIQVSAATLGRAAAAAGVSLGPGVVAVLDGHGPLADPDAPLVAGDELTFTTRS